MPRAAALGLSAALAVALLAGCATPAVDIDTDEPTGEAPPAEAPESDVVSFDQITSAATCIFTPDELTAAFASWSEYVAGPAQPDTSSSQATCEYSHADEALQYVSVPFTIWVEGYSYTDPDLAFRAGFGEVDAPDGITRATIEAHYCPPDGGRPPEVAAATVITCASTADATIFAFDDFRALVARDDIIWEVVASGASSDPFEPQLDSLLQVARLAAQRTI